MTALDTDGDGKLAAAEIANAPKSLLTLDKNGDGMISADELHPQGMAGPRDGGQPPADDLVATLMAFDKNGDGQLTKDEVPERMQGVFARGDSNGDGVLTTEESTKMVAVQQTAARQGGPGGPMQGPPVDPLTQALDADRDGTISKEEIGNASKALISLDKNRDGMLTADELRPAFGPGGPPRDRR